MAYQQPQHPQAYGRPSPDPNNPFGSNHGHAQGPLGGQSYESGESDEYQRDPYASEENMGARGKLLVASLSPLFPSPF